MGKILDFLKLIAVGTIFVFLLSLYLIYLSVEQHVPDNIITYIWWGHSIVQLGNSAMIVKSDLKKAFLKQMGIFALFMMVSISLTFFFE